MSIRVNFSKQTTDKFIELDLDIKSTGVTAIYGPSGAGKTTLLRVIAGLENLTNASVSFDQKIWQNSCSFIAPESRHIGLVFQQPSLFEHLNVEQNIYFCEGLKAYKNRQQRFDVRHFISLFQLTPLLKRSVQTLSGGEQQRVAIVRALATQPDLLLMDEPLSALDDKLKSQFLDALEVLLKQISIPVIYVTHAKAELARISNQIVLIDNGGVVGQGASTELLTDLSQPLTLGSDLQCALNASVKSIDQQHHVTTLTTPGGELRVSSVDKRVGENLKVVIHAKDVSITLSRAQDTSILNVLPGSIDEFKFTENGSVILKLQVGEAVILSQITQKSFYQLKLVKQLPVFVQIKAVVLA